MQPTAISLSVDNEAPIPTAAGQSIRRLWLPFSVIAALPWLALTAEYIRNIFRYTQHYCRVVPFRVLTTIILFNFPSANVVTNSISFLKTAEDAAILKELGLKGKWTFFWVKMIAFCVALTTVSIDLLQVSQFSNGSVATLLLLFAIVVAFNSLVTSIIYCWYAYNTTRDYHVAAWKQMASILGDNTVGIMISLPLAYFLWAVLLLCLAFAASYACPPTVCIRFSDASPHIALIGPPLLAALVLICYALHGFFVAYILRRYHTSVSTQSLTQELEVAATNP